MAISAWEKQLIERQRVARLATVGVQGQPHVVPIVFAFDGQRLFTPIDSKPKRVSARDLQRVRDILSNPRVSVLFDEYDEDWRKLAWVQVRGLAEFVESGLDQETGIALLNARYPQYANLPLTGSPIILVTVQVFKSWRAANQE